MGEKVPVTRLSEGLVVELPLDKINEWIPVLNIFNLEICKKDNKLYMLIKDKDSLSNLICEVNYK